ncbi:(2R)-sulfolactate sulfo-lyase subunit beta [Fusobacterium sp. DD29]|uniref:UxaA family hydrolase n=1 Tax=unclassified Fusobacterium TaxID=2648384 RepID=UPI001B8CBF86|nr:MULTISPECIES: UxaA family hydrolase [unclassified Fusobacterium]MBR8700893.1 (2R)-sulfolactate sulfo-lyase subunit beta [Fusobacterium sp. DD45]MBR8710643.1 (2R)-sulfolactate sulfo-lyase subunit beta [Fusobacterium sp. DD28]MBR8748822.1 (2R)-sulfolactate sulfo-lyase subunit beta [Fusobacterium sp. DD29]MBR8751243.1 (2R)-sulfolactate sulfo-lyase subunit beta [Fusobacterium sp. DD26]MBR8761089.1 (2R)-sulfolactate sulfo-lyase subunit beta [Fusobacterium sp. DD25]
MKFMGYKRKDGKVGIRNYVLILATSVCSNKLAQDISNAVEGTTHINNTFGCCQIASDARLTTKTIINTGIHPNVGAVLVVGLGCEGTEPLHVYEEIKKTGKPVEMITIQGEGGTLKAYAKGVSIARKFVQDLSLDEKVECDISDLILGMECGGSDTTSGLASNPTCGVASDIIVNNGGTSILSETTEFIGAEHVVAKRGINAKVSQEILDLVRGCEKRAMALGEDIRGGQPTPGNIEGGLTSIEEKSLGCIHKSGTAPFQGVLQYADIPTEKGLFIMDTPGQDIESITGMVAGGAQIVIFTTGRGTPTGNPLAPVIKLTGNAHTYNNMKDNIDFDVSEIISGHKTIEEMGKKLLEEIIAVCNGKTTKAEALKHREFCIYKTAPTF